MQAIFLDQSLCQKIHDQFGSPVYVYNESLLYKQAEQVLAFPNAYGLTVRYAMKANPNINILKLFNSKGIHIDASTSYEVMRALAAGISGNNIQVSGQEFTSDLNLIISNNIFFVATSLHQLETYGKNNPNSEIGIRINPGVGSGAFKKIDTGGPTSSFGIRYEYIDEIQTISQKYNLKITKLHIHIGSENIAEARAEATQDAIEIIKEFPDITTLNMGGGFKIALMPYEKTADLQSIGNKIKNIFTQFYEETGRKLHLEIEPGKFLVMNTCSLLARVIDIVDTGKDGFKFIKLNTGMTELPRVSMYGIQQPIHIITDTDDVEEYVVVGHCCESGDLLTCILYQCDDIEPRFFKKAKIGDFVVVQSCGAYNSAMSMKNYNSYPEAGEILLRENGEIIEIRSRQKIEDIRRNEIDVL